MKTNLTDTTHKDNIAHRKLADEYFERAAWSREHSTAGYVELFLNMANYHLKKSKLIRG